MGVLNSGPQNVRLNTIGGILLLLCGQVPVFYFDEWVFVLIPYVLINAAGLVLLVVAAEAFGLVDGQLEAAWRGAGALFAVGMLSFSVLDYLVDPGPEAIFYNLRWLLAAIVFIAVFFYDSVATPSGT